MESSDPVDDENNYLAGVFYSNPNDKRVFVPKRIRAMGWSVNFANPYTYLFFLIVIILIVWVRIEFL